MKLHIKRLLSYSAVLSVVLAGFLYAHHASAAGEIKLYASPSSITQTTGNQFDLGIRVNKNSSDRVDYADVYISFPASRLEVVSVSASGSAFNLNSSFASSYDNRSGLIHISGESNALGTPSDVLIATVKLRAKASGRSDVTFMSDSAVGDLFGPGKVKNYLTTRTGAVITLNDAAVSTPPSSGTVKPVTPSTAADPTPPDAPIDVPLNDIVNTSDGSYELAIDGVGASSSGNGVGAAVPASSNILLDRYGVVGGAVLGVIVLGLAGWKVFGAHRERQGAAIVIWDDETPEVSDGVTVPEVESDQGTELDELISELPTDPVPQPEYVPIPETPEPIPAQPVVQQPSVAQTVQPPSLNAPVMQASPVVTPQPAVEPTPPLDVQSAVVSQDNIPDMFDLGEERLRREGYVSNVGPRAPQA